MNGWEPKNVAVGELMKRWVREQVALFEALRGEVVVGWAGTEMAIRDAGPSGEPQFGESEIPFLQLRSLYLAFESGGTRVIRLEQTDNSWRHHVHRRGIWRIARRRLRRRGIYWTRTLTELPTGRIESVNVGTDDEGNIAEMSLLMGNNRIIITSGEVYEELDGSLRVVRPDESVLVHVTRLAT